MKLTIRLYLLQLKRYFRALPLALLGSLIFLLLTGAASAGIFKYFHNDDEESIVKATVGVVTGDIDDSYVKLGLNMLGNMSSTSSYFSFEVMEPDKAAKALEKGKIIAVFEFPDGAIDGILNGTNDPITIKFNESNPLSSVLLTELTRSGATLLSAAQAGTYTTADIFYICDEYDNVYTAFGDVDDINFKFVLKRGSLFEEEDRDETGNATVLYYIGTAVILVLIFFGLTLSENIHYDNDAYLMFGKSHRGFEASYYFAKLLSLSTIFYIVTVLLLTALVNIPALSTYFKHVSTTNLYLCPIFIAIFIASFITMLMFIMPRGMDGILLTFITSIVLTVISGLLIPLAFMPEAFITLHNYLPFTTLHSSIVSIAGLQKANILAGLIYICCFIIIGLIMLHNKIRKAS